MDLNKMTNTQKLNSLLNLDNKDDLLIVGSYQKNRWQHKIIIGDEMILSALAASNSFENYNKC
jgi:hypothetical protein